MTLKEMRELVRGRERANNEKEMAKRADWRQTVTSQHTVLATLAGLQVTALTLFAAFSQGERSGWQRLFFVLSLVLFAIIIACLVFISEHERKDAFSGASTPAQRNRENKIRFVLNWATALNAITVGLLLIISY